MNVEDNIKEFYQEQRVDKVPDSFKERVMNFLLDTQSVKEERKVGELSLLKFAFSVLVVIVVMSGIYISFQRKDRVMLKDITYTGEKEKKVMIMGDFNKWRPQEMEYDGEKWIIRTSLNYMTTYLILKEGSNNGEVLENASLEGAKIMDYFGNYNLVFISD